jgi:hypothetical protein
MRALPAGLALVLALGAAVGAASCSRADDPEETTFYDRKIGPILSSSCASSPTQSGCHVAADDRGNALGNLDLQSYASLAQRRDLLLDYGPYGLPALLLRVVPPQQLRLTSWDDDVQVVTTDVAHDAGALLDVTSVSFSTLDKWIRNGATQNNAPAKPLEKTLTACSTELGSDPLFDPSIEPSAGDFAIFRERVNPVLGGGCAAGNCHGSRTNSLYLTCGDSPEQLRWNYFAAGDYVSANPSASEILRRVLPPSRGGTFHEGGAVFESADDDGYRALSDWAAQKGGPGNAPADPGFSFFAKRVQPMLVKRGCMQINCHASSMFHDYRLRGGSGGHFGLPATRRNYELTLQEVALESPDPNASRLLRKNLAPPPGGAGIVHRGGALFSGDGDPAACDLAAAESGPLDEQRPYCVIVAWLALERAARMAGAQPLSAIVYVERPPAPRPNTAQDFELFAPGADLVLAPVTPDAAGDPSPTGSAQSLLAQCGLSAGIDVRRPSVSWDGKRVAFAARSSAAEPLRVYVLDLGAGSCALEPTIAAPPVDSEGQPIDPAGALVHDFDPAFSPDGRVVFASTRGNLSASSGIAIGPSRTPADPSKQNANLYVLESGKIRQLTFLSNQELAPAFMSDGRVIFTAEKRAPGFYQLAGRRQNLDGGDYHPLFGQRATIGYDQLTDVVELADQNLAAILSDRGALHGAGTLAIINRSIGVDQLSTDPAHYTQEPAAIDWPNPAFYQRAIRILDSGAGATPGAAAAGAYRNPSPLPNGKLLASYAPNVVDVGNFDGRFEIVVVDPISAQRSSLFSDPQNDLLWPAAVYARQDHGVFDTRLDEPNGASRLTPAASDGRAEVLFLDVPLLSSLLFQNTRSGRKIPPTGQLELWQSLPPEPGITGFGQSPFELTDQYGPLYVRRQLLGSVPLHSDGSAKVSLPGGAAIVIGTDVQLSGDGTPSFHHQREELQFYPGELARQGFPRSLFDGLCAGCHGSVTGFETRIAVNPDILTSASNVLARDAQPLDLTTAKGEPKAGPFP